jgi:hypothetical protein
MTVCRWRVVLDVSKDCNAYVFSASRSERDRVLEREDEGTKMKHLLHQESNPSLNDT